MSFILILAAAAAVLTDRSMDLSVLPMTAGLERPRNPAHGDYASTLAFQLAPDHVPPVWPDPARPQQAHIDFDVDDLELAEQQVLALGATRAAVQPGDDFTVFIDPAGHPFCLVLVED